MGIVVHSAMFHFAFQLLLVGMRQFLCSGLTEVGSGLLSFFGFRVFSFGIRDCTLVGN